MEADKEKSPEDVIQTILGSVPREPFTVVVLESTAKGIGNFFHDTWCDAVDGKSAYTPLFVPWFEIDIYYKPFINEKQKIEFIQSMTRDELTRFYAGPRWRASTGTGRSDASIRPIGRCAASFPQPPMKRSKLPDARRMTRCMSASSGPLSGNRCMSGNCSPMRPTGPKLCKIYILCQRPPEIFTFGSCLIPRGVSPTAMRWRSTLAGAVPMPTGVLFRYSTVSP